MRIPPELRPMLFSGIPWYEQLAERPSTEPTAWFLLRDPEPEWYVQLLNATIEFLQRHKLVPLYRGRLRAIRPGDLTPGRAQSERRNVSQPIWDVLNEPLVGLVLERAAGWTLLQPDPPGRSGRLGDWLFRTPSGRDVFVEVKSPAEIEATTGSGTRSDYRPRIRAEVRRAYGQLPSDGRATMIVIVGNEMVRVPFGLMLGDLFQAMFGQYEVRLRPFEQPSRITYQGPSWRDMLVHGTKHRQLGCLCGLLKRGVDRPFLGLYTIHNPFADPTVRLPATDLGGLHQFAVDDEHVGREAGVDNHEVWGRLQLPTWRRDPASDAA